MSKLELLHFGEIDTKNLKNEYDAEIEFNDRNVDIFLNEMGIVKKEQLDFIKHVLENLLTFDKQNKSYISKDFENELNGSLTFDFLSYHLNELAEGFEDIIDTNETETNNLVKLMGTLQLQTMSFYSDVVMFDYSLNDEVSDQLLAVKIDRQKNTSISWES